MLIVASATSAYSSKLVSIRRNAEMGDLSRAVFHVEGVYATADWNWQQMAVGGGSALLQGKRDWRLVNEENAKKGWKSSRSKLTLFPDYILLTINIINSLSFSHTPEMEICDRKLEENTLKMGTGVYSQFLLLVCWKYSLKSVILRRKYMTQIRDFSGTQFSKPILETHFTCNGSRHICCYYLWRQMNISICLILPPVLNTLPLCCNMLVATTKGNKIFWSEGEWSYVVLVAFDLQAIPGNAC